MLAGARTSVEALIQIRLVLVHNEPASVLVNDGVVGRDPEVHVDRCHVGVNLDAAAGGGGVVLKATLFRLAKPTQSIPSITYRVVLECPHLAQLVILEYARKFRAHLLRNLYQKREKAETNASGTTTNVDRFGRHTRVSRHACTP